MCELLVKYLISKASPAEGDSRGRVPAQNDPTFVDGPIVIERKGRGGSRVRQTFWRQHASKSRRVFFERSPSILDSETQCGRWVQRLLGLVLIGCQFLAGAGPFKPASDDLVVERVRTTSRARPPAASQKSGQPSRVSIEDSSDRIAAARKLVEQYQAEADPRYLGYAGSSLAPVFEQPSPPSSAFVLRAIIRQSTHRFESALDDLDRALSLDPRDGQAWLTRATILQVQGRYEEARESCIRLFGLCPELVAVTSAAGLGSLTGHAAPAYSTIHAALSRNSSAPVAERAWAITIAADCARRLGWAEKAGKDFQTALELRPDDASILGEYADWLLDQRRFQEAADLLESRLAHDALLLRFCEARKATAGEVSARAHFARLQARFDSIHRRGDNVHLREEARYELKIRGDARKALQLAAANWQMQKEPADARILAESALAARDSTQLDALREWVAKTGLEDLHLNSVLSATTER